MNRLLVSFLSILSLAATACGDPASSARAAGAASTSGSGGAGRRVFLASAVEHPDFTVTLPLYRGTSHGRTVWYVVFDSSSGADAEAKGVNSSQKLAHAGDAAQKATVAADGTVDFQGGTVDFGARAGEAGYSPLVRLPDGTVENAPHVANASGQHPKVVSIDTVHGTVTLRQTEGFSGGKEVRYVSTDASIPDAAALENVVLAPELNAAPAVGQDGTDQARTSLAAFVNGQTGIDNPQRQGINSALLGEGSPLNILRWAPNQGRYSPLWDVHLAKWQQGVVDAGQNLRQTDFGDVLGLAMHGLVTAPDGTQFAASGFIVNCPIVSQEG
jgi:hypothetical protein